MHREPESEVPTHESLASRRSFRIFGLLSVEHIAQVLTAVFLISLTLGGERANLDSDTRRIESLEAATMKIQEGLSQMMESQARTEEKITAIKDQLDRRDQGREQK